MLCMPGAPEAMSIVVPAEKVRSLLLDQYILPLGALIIILVKPDKVTLEETVRVPLIVRTPLCPVSVEAFIFVPLATV